MTQAHVTMASNGRLIIPAAMRVEIGLAEGRKQVARVENGVVVLESIDVAIRRAMPIPLGPMCPSARCF